MGHRPRAPLGLARRAPRRRRRAHPLGQPRPLRPARLRPATRSSAPRRPSRSGRRSTATSSTPGTPSSTLEASTSGSSRSVTGTAAAFACSSRDASSRWTTGSRGTSSRCATSRRATVASGGSPISRCATPRPGSSTATSSRRGSAQRCDARRRAGTGLAVVLAELGVRGRTGEGVFRRPEALIAVERLARAGRAGDDLARTRDGELAWILPETDGDGAVEAVARLARRARAARRRLAHGRRLRPRDGRRRALALCARRPGAGASERRVSARPRDDLPYELAA